MRCRQDRFVIYLYSFAIFTLFYRRNFHPETLAFIFSFRCTDNGWVSLAILLANHPMTNVTMLTGGHS